MSTNANDMTDKLRRAVALIKAGDKQGGQRILAEVLSSDLQNEQAWLWMSTVVEKDKRRYCLEKALSINPDNAHAKQALAQLSQIEALPSSSPPPDHESKSQSSAIPSPVEVMPEAESAAKPVESETPAPDVWIKQRKYHLDVSVLAKDDLTVGRIGLHHNQEFKARLEQGLPLSDLFIAKEIVPLSAVAKVTLSLGAVRVSHSKKNGSTGSIYVPCPDEETAEAALKAFHQRLGPNFERTQAPIRTCLALGIPTIFTVIVMACTTLFYLMAQEAMTRGIGGSARTKALWAILGLLGPNGVLCIGGVLFLLCIILLIRWGLKPPLETTLAPKDKEGVT